MAQVRIYVHMQRGGRAFEHFERARMANLLLQAISIFGNLAEDWRPACKQAMQKLMWYMS